MLALNVADEPCSAVGTCLYLPACAWAEPRVMLAAARMTGE
jgi:hypothetical protein